MAQKLYYLLLCFLFFMSANIYAEDKVPVDPDLIVLFSDIHCPPNGYQGPKFEQKIQELLKMNPRPAHLLIYGDFAHLFGKIEDYTALKKMMAPVDAAGIPWHVTFGNHDRHTNFFKVFPERIQKNPNVPNKYVNIVETSKVLFVLLDSHLEDKVSGAIDAEQRKWLETVLAKSKKPVLVGCHHPLSETKLTDLFKKYPSFAGYIYGHNHYWKPLVKDGIHTLCLPSTGHWGDIGYVTARISDKGIDFTLHQDDFYREKKSAPDRPADWQEIVKKRNGSTFHIPFNTIQKPSVVWMDSLDCKSMQIHPYVPNSGWHPYPQAYKAKIDGQERNHGIQFYTPGRLGMELPSGKITFSVWAGNIGPKHKPGKVEFKVVGDGKLLWSSGTVEIADAPKLCRLELDNVRYLTLMAIPVGDIHQECLVCWADAQFSSTSIPLEGQIRMTNLPIDLDGNVLDQSDEAGREYLALTCQILVGMEKKPAIQAYNIQATLLPSDRDPLDILLRRTESLCEHLKKTSETPILENESQKLVLLREKSVQTKPEWKKQRRDLFNEVFKLRRTISLSNPILDFKDIVFIKRHYNPEAEKTGNHMCDEFFGFHSRPGGGIFILKNAFAQNTKDQSIIDLLQKSTVENGRLKGRSLDKTWGFLAPTLSYNAQEVCFAAADTSSPRHSYTWTEDNCYHLFKVGIDGKKLTQITDGNVNDLDPWYMPNERIVFISERRGGFGRCHARPCPSYTLHSMETDGSDITCLSSHETNEWAPSIDHNGMIVYTRWDYVDRGFNQAHHPWITYPDGRDPRAIQGNYSEDERGRPHFETSFKPIPESNKLVGTAKGHHTQYFGSVILLDPNVEDDDTGGDPMAPLKRITPDQLFPEAEISPHHAPACYGQPFPLSEEFYLVSYDPFSGMGRGECNNYGLYLLDVFGNKILLYRDAEISCQCPWPILEREVPPVIPHQTLVGIPRSEKSRVTNVPKELPKTGIVGVTNVYNTIRPFPEGTKIKELRIVQILPKTTWNCNDPWIGYGAEKSARRVLGTVPVEKDGSARFDMPVDVPVYFQALDENGVAVQTMRSATYVKPGESLTCNGCHEGRNNTSGNRLSGYPSAFRRKPSMIQADVPGSDPFNYPILVQTILDRHCVDCHAQEAKNKKTFPLDRGPKDKHFFNSYINLRPYIFVYASNHNTRMDPPVTFLPNHGGAWDAFLDARTFPGKFGANASKLWILLKKGHYNVNLSPSEKRALALWMDNNADFYGGYEFDTLAAQREGKTIKPTLE